VYGIDYSRLVTMMRASILNAGDGSASPKVPRKPDFQTVDDSDNERTITAGEGSNSPPRRVPDIESSRARLDLVGTLARELATIKQDLAGYCTADSLKAKHPKFVLWEHLEQGEVKELVDGMDFAPKAFAENLTLRKFGLSSRETLKKDRRKLRRARKAEPS